VKRADETGRQEPSSRLVVGLLLAVILLGGGLRLFRLADDNLWADEGISALVSGQPGAGAVVQAVIELDNHPPLYYLLLHVWRGPFGSSDFTLRLLSVMLGIATIPVIFAAGRELFDDSGGLTASLLFAVSPVAVHFAQEARMYTLLMLLFAALVYFALRLERCGDVVSIIGVIVVCAVLPNVHFYGGPVVAATLLLLIWSFWQRREERRRLGVVAGAALATVLAFAPWAVALTQKQLAFAATLPHLSPPSLSSIGETFARFLRPVSTLDARGLLALLTVAAGIVLLIALARTGATGSRTLRWCLVLVLLPVALIAIIGQFAPFWVGQRVASVAAVPLALALGGALAGAWRRGWRWQAGALGGLMLAQAVVASGELVIRPSRPDWEGLSAQIVSQEQPGDVVLLVHDHWIAPLFERYYAGALPRYGVDRAILDRGLLREIIENARQPGGRLWLVAYHERQSPLADVLAKEMMQVEERNFRGPVLLLFEPAEDAVDPDA
jgi:mannosyltransferase